jgi:CoA:oxalate CoA-transferase
MLDCQLAILENAFLRYALTGETPGPLGTRHSWAVPFQAFPTADGHIVVALAWGVPNQWALLCAELGVPELIDDPRFAESHRRSANHGELEPLLAAAFRARTTGEWVDALRRFEIPCGPLNTIPEAASLPQVQAREMLVPVRHHTLGELPLVNTPIKLSRTPGGIRGSSPDMGQDTRDVLRELLELDDARIDRLLEAAVVWDQRPPVELA